MCKISYYLFAASMILFVSCSEILPPIVDNPVSLAVTLKVPQGNLSMNVAAEPKLVFRFEIENKTGEVLEGAEYFNGYIDIYRSDDPSVFAHFEFKKDEPDNILLIPTGNELSLALFWDQKMDNGDFLWKEIDTGGIFGGEESDLYPITRYIKIKGKIQIFKHLGILETEEVEIALNYYYRF